MHQAAHDNNITILAMENWEEGQKGKQNDHQSFARNMWYSLVPMQATLTFSMTCCTHFSACNQFENMRVACTRLSKWNNMHMTKINHGHFDVVSQFKNNIILIVSYTETI